MSDKHSSANGSQKRTLSLSLPKKKRSSQSRLGSSQGPLKQTQIELRPPANGIASDSSRSPPPAIRTRFPPSSSSFLNIHKQQDQENPQSITPSIGDYACPICQHDLGDVKSSFLRQRHVEECLEATATASLQDNKIAEAASTSILDEFEYCLFCGKNVTHLDGWRKDAHFSRCMDAYIEEEGKNDDDKSSSSISFIGQLEICPCCHEFGPFQKTVRKKIQHLKQCAKARHMSMQQLLQKLKWIGWGHVPMERQNPATAAAVVVEPPLLPPAFVPPVTIRATSLAEDDDDFSSVVLLHKRADPAPSHRKTKRENPEVDGDDGLALALALSLSENQPAGSEQPTPQSSSTRSNKRQGVTDTASVLSIDESKQVVKRELTALLYADEQSLERNCYCLTPLPPSRLLLPATGGPSLWQLAAMENTVVNANHVYRSKFLCEDGL